MGKFLIAALKLGLLPIWRAGYDEGITMYEWLWHHTVWGPEVTHVPEEDYQSSFEDTYGRRIGVRVG